jgi:ABC-type transport system involved in cytochrome c biogenesis ATPase subunit
MSFGFEKTKEVHRSEKTSRPSAPILDLHRFQSLNHVALTSKRYRSICNLPLQLRQRNLWLLDECGGDILASVTSLPDGASIYSIGC